MRDYFFPKKQPASLLEAEVIGTCGKCGGPVVTPKVFYSVAAPVPVCQKCGATKRQPFGPVIDME